MRVKGLVFNPLGAIKIVHKPLADEVVCEKSDFFYSSAIPTTTNINQVLVHRAWDVPIRERYICTLCPVIITSKN